MSLQSRLTALATAVGTDIKALNAKVLVGAAAMRSGAGASVDVGGGVWKNVQIGAASIIEPSDAFTVVGGAVGVKDAGWYRVSASVISPSGATQALMVALSTSSAPGDGDIANNEAYGTFVRASTSGNVKMLAGGTIYLHAMSSNVSPVNTTCQQFAIERIGGPTGLTGPGGSILVQEEGVSLPVRAKINLVGPNITATDDAANDRTIITASIPFVTTGSLAAGQGGIPNPIPDRFEVFFQSSIMEPLGAVWHMRYRAGSTSTNKWEYVGGSELTVLAGNELAGWSVYQALATPQSFICPATGEYRFEYGGQGYNPSASYAYIGLHYGGALQEEVSAFLVAGSQEPMSKVSKGPVNAGVDVNLKFRTSVPSANFLGRYLTIRPIRLA